MMQARIQQRYARQQQRFVVPLPPPPPPHLGALVPPPRPGVHVSPSRAAPRTGATSSNSGVLSSETSACLSLGLAGSLGAAVVACMVLASPADSAEAAHAGATSPNAAIPHSSNPVLPLLASGDLYFSDGTPYRSVAELICASYSATVPAAPSVMADVPLSTTASLPAPNRDQQQQGVNEPSSPSLDVGEDVTVPTFNSPFSSGGGGADATSSASPSRSSVSSAGRTAPVLGELALVEIAPRPMCEVDAPTPGTVPISAADLIKWQEGDAIDLDAAAAGAGASTSGGVDGAETGTVGWLQQQQQAVVGLQGGMPSGLELPVPGGGVAVRLPIAALGAHAVPWWATLVALGVANVLGLQAVLAVMKRLGDRAEPLTLVRLQLGLVHPPGAPGGRQLKELRSRLSQLTAMKQVGQSGLWLIVEETMLELSKHQQCAALADVSAVHTESKLEAYDLFGQFAREECSKARAEEVNAHVEGDNSCEMDWNDSRPSQADNASSSSNSGARSLLHWLSARPQFEESGCDDAMVVTVIVVARGHLDVPTRAVSCWQDLCGVMKTVCGLTSDRMIAVDVTWAPSTDGTFLTRDMLVSDYANLKPLVR